MRIVQAAQAEPGLMGGLSRCRGAVKQRRIAAVKEAIEAGEPFDPALPVPLPIRCDRAWHRLRLKVDGSLTPLHHRDVDLETERIAVALGATALPCLSRLDYTACRFTSATLRRVARIEPVSPVELLGFVLAWRLWARPLHEVGVALEAGLTPADLAAHLDVAA